MQTLYQTEVSERTFAKRVGRDNSEVVGWCQLGHIPSRMSGTGRYRIPKWYLALVLSGKKTLPDGKPPKERSKDKRLLYGAAALLGQGKVPKEQRKELIALIEEMAEALAEEK